MSEPPPVPQRSADRVTPSRVPFYERRRSLLYRNSQRSNKNANDDSKHRNQTQVSYPTRPAQVLLPSAIRERGFIYEDQKSNSRASSSNRPSARVNRLKSRRAEINRAPLPSSVVRPPKLPSKRSVKALRDHYESQASRPSTAASPPLRPLTASSTALRSVNSRDELPTIESLYQPSTEYMGLPPLTERSSIIRDHTPQLSLSSQPAKYGNTPSPNLIRVGRESSNAYFEQLFRSPNLFKLPAQPSSPNLHVLGASSSRDVTPADSPNIVRLGGSSSPNYVEMGFSESSFEPSLQKSLSKYGNRESEDEQNYSQVKSLSDPFGSSPPVQRMHSYVSTSTLDLPSLDKGDLTSSSPFPSSDITSLKECPDRRASKSTSANRLSSGPDRSSSAFSRNEGSGVFDFSSPPSINYPIVKAPRSSAIGPLHVRRRPQQSMAEPPSEESKPNRSSMLPVSSEEETQRNLPMSDEEDPTDILPLSQPAQAYLARSRDVSPSPTRSTIGDDEDDDNPEATDLIADLRSHQVHMSSEYISLLTSTDSRNNSIKKSIGSRPSSIRRSLEARLNTLRRLDSSSSLVSNLPIPTWARRYYSGECQGPFYAIDHTSSSHVPSHPGSAAAVTPIDRSPVRILRSRENRPTTWSPDTHLGQAQGGIHRPRNRPHLTSARQSHLVPGLGPLVSHPSKMAPISPPAHMSNSRSTWSVAERSAGRSIERPFEPPVGRTMLRNSVLRHSTQKSSILRPQPAEWSPHLYHHHRASQQNPWQAPSVDERREKLFSLRNVQVLCFVTGFVFPISWFVAAALPLPPKPGRREMSQISSEQADVEAGRQSRPEIRAESRYVNTRWWRILNRFMCVVGLVMVAIIITLALLGTRGKGFSSSNADTSSASDSSV